MRNKGWMLAIGAGVILLAAVSLTIGRGWIRGTPAPADINIMTGAAAGPGALDENALIAANAERPYRAPPAPVRPKAEETPAPVAPPAPAVEPAPAAAEPADEGEEAAEKPVDNFEDDPVK